MIHYYSVLKQQVEAVTYSLKLFSIIYIDILNLYGKCMLLGTNQLYECIIRLVGRTALSLSVVLKITIASRIAERPHYVSE